MNYYEVGRILLKLEEFQKEIEAAKRAIFHKPPQIGNQRIAQSYQAAYNHIVYAVADLETAQEREHAQMTVQDLQKEEKAIVYEMGHRCMSQETKTLHMRRLQMLRNIIEAKEEQSAKKTQKTKK